VSPRRADDQDAEQYKKLRADLDSVARRAATGVLGPRHGAVDEIVAETIIRVHDRLEVLDQKKDGGLKPFAKVVAQRLALDVQRNERKLIPHLRGLNSEEADDALEDFLGRELDQQGQSIGSDVANRMVLEDAMAVLAPEVQEMLRLRYGDGETFEAIATRLGSTAEAVRKRTKRARDVLLTVLFESRQDLLGKHRPG
jgi:RNA polymerase sigma factor (sigma-70 family)